MVETVMQKYGDSYAVYVPAKVIGLMPFAPDEIIDMEIRSDRVIIKRNKR
jgi:antitoxin component of MazEF toxin-antitoxin module